MHASTNFFESQIRIEGKAEKLPLSEADQYFKSRPYKSQVGSACSNQSKPIEGRHVLARKAEQLAAQYKEGEFPRPPQW